MTFPTQAFVRYDAWHMGSKRGVRVRSGCGVVIVLCTTLAARPLRAEAPTPDPGNVPAVTAGSATPTDPAPATPDTELEALRERIERADFQAAEPRLHALIDGDSLAVTQQNLALELLSVCALAARREKDAESLLARLYARDPQHRLSVAELGPHIAAAFERAERSHPARVPVDVALAVRRASDGRPVLDVALRDPTRAVQTVHAYIRYDGDPASTHLVGAAGEASYFLLPEPSASTGMLSAYVEARAPSGAELGSVASAAEPMRLEVFASQRTPPCAVAPPATPLRQRWWLWTSVSIAFAGLVTGSAIAAR